MRRNGKSRALICFVLCMMRLYILQSSVASTEYGCLTMMDLCRMLYKVRLPAEQQRNHKKL